MLKIFFVILLLFSTQAIAEKLHKKNALNQTKEIVDQQTMFNAGSWYLFMNHCEGTFTKAWRLKLGKLSWPDFKNLLSRHFFTHSYDLQICSNDLFFNSRSVQKY